MSITTAFATLSTASLSVTPAQQFFTGEFLYYALVFFVLALVAALFGARGIAGLSMAIARWLIIIFVVLAVIALIL